MSRWESLLVVQGHDTRADQLTHRLATLPERAKLAEVGTQVAELDGNRARRRIRSVDAAACEQYEADDAGNESRHIEAILAAPDGPSRLRGK